MSIQAKQNSDEYIGLLKASSSLYAKAKFFGTTRVTIAVFAVVCAPIALYFFPGSSLPIGLAGTVLSIVSELWLESVEDDYKQMAAKVQEQFDTGLFSLSWNETCVGPRLVPEIIQNAIAAYKGTYPLENWYPDTTEIPRPLDVLICQRANLVWDWRLRRHFATAIISAATIWAIVIVCVGSLVKQTTATYYVAILFPALPAIIQSIKSWQGHTKNAQEKQELVNATNSLWQKGMENLRNVADEDCRRIQDRIYTLRKEGPMVPNRWFRRLRDRYEKDMKLSAEQFKAEVMKKYGS